MRLALPALLLLGACAGPLPTVASGPAPNPMAIDGDAREWDGALRPVPEESGLSMGLRNDADALYLVFVAGDDWQARRIAARGLTVWLNGEGSTRRAYGLTFPVGLASDGERPGEVERPGRRAARDLREPSRERFLLSLDRVRLMREGDERSLAVGGEGGIETAAAWTADGLTVELRIPLGSGPFGVGLAPGGVLGLGIELGEPAGGTRAGLHGRVPIGGRDVRRSPDASPRPRRREAGGAVVRWMAVELAPGPGAVPRRPGDPASR